MRAVKGREDPAPRRNVLFVCSRNQWRSPTAEQVFRKHPALSVRSRGTSAQARRRVTDDDVRWADAVLVMEPKHRARLLAAFAPWPEGTALHVLEIPDEYEYMDPELVELLQVAVSAALGVE
ncbi:MAG: hypothetical protein R3A48_23895 [Polyangiales bacterium]